MEQNFVARETNFGPRTFVPDSQSRTSWGAIFGGTFVYLAVMATFGSLGGAIFADAGNATGMIVWMTILAIISLYVAGRASGALAGVRERTVGMYQGLITFGMSVFASILVLSLVWASTTAAGTQAAGAVTRWDVVSIAGTGGWGLFFALFFGMLGAIAGGSQSAPARLAEVVEHPEARRAA